MDGNELRDRLIQAHPDLLVDRSPHFAPLLDAVLEAADSNGRLDQRALNTVLKKQCKSAHRPDRPCLRRLIKLLERLNADGTLKAVLPTLPVPNPRPSVLPVSADQFARIQSAEALVDFLLQTWLPAQSSAAARSLAAGMLLVAQTGAGEEVACGILARLRPGDVSAQGVLTTPTHIAELSGNTHSFRPPEPLRGLLLEEAARAGDTDPGALLLDAAPGVDAPDPAEGAEASIREAVETVRRTLGAAFRDLVRDFEQVRGGWPAGGPVGTWKRFAHTARFLPLRAGFPPFLLELMRSYPLPAEVQGFTPVDEEGSRFLGERVLRDASEHSHRLATNDNAQTTEPGPVTLYDDEPPEDWPRLARNRLSTFVKRIEALAPSGRIRAKRQQEQLHALLTEALDEVDAIAPPTSLLHVVLHWSVKKLDQDGGKISSLKTHYSRVFSRALFSNPETWDLQEWDDETVEEVTRQILAGKAWGRTTRGSFLMTWGEFLRYAQHHGLLAEASLVRFTGDNSPANPRTEILKPQEFGYLDRLQAKSRQGRMMACALVLGGFGALRAAEVCGLTIGDVYAADGELYVYSRAGKSAAARRKVPLHLVAPPEHVALVREWWAERTGELPPNTNGHEAGLFGPQGDPAAYQRNALIDPLLAWLRSIIGRDADFHLLRHTAASWLLLRWYAAHNPDFAETFAKRGGWFFGEASLAGVRHLLEGEAFGADTDHNALLRLSKFLGHRGLDTLMVHYAHTLAPIHSHALGKLEGLFDKAGFR